jgi:N-acetyl-1-D-myo-inositol-2-amino-2-deoxy-alpha-D-glucopyranoside deacetylase
MTRTMLVVVAHPDDETFGCGSIIAAAAAAGAEVAVCCATRGEAGEAKPGSVPEGSDLGRVREAELRDAAAFLGATRVHVLDYADSGWDGEPPAGSLCAAPVDEAAAAVAAVITAEHPDVVVTLDGSDGHRDHKRICAATTAAFDAVASPGTRLYAITLPRSLMLDWLRLHEDSVYAAEDNVAGVPDDVITTVLDASAHLSTRLEGITRHASQTSPYDDLPIDLRDRFLTVDRLIRLRPRWEGGAVEHSLWSTTS